MTKKTRLKVQVYVVSRDADSGEPRFLILKRPESRGGIWQPVTGKVESDEPLLDAARREVREETALTGLCEWRDVLTFEFSKDEQCFRETVFIARTDSCNVILSAEHTAASWEPYLTAREMIAFESNKQALDRVMRLLDKEKMRE